jgi:glycosyltransferase involved in cell wall biosynthesis
MQVGDIDAIYAIMSPFASATACAELSRRLGVGWIADMGDPWALDEMFIYPTELHRQLEIAHMRKLLRTTAAVVMSTPEAARQLAETFPELTDRPIVSIPNGYDAADFADVTPAPRTPDTFRIVHTGYLHTELGLQQRRSARLRRILGGATPGVDILTRSHVYLLQAIDQLLARDPSLHGRLELHLAGVLSDHDKALAAQSPATVLHGYLSHADSIALMRSADLLFLPMQNLPPGRRSTTVPGKTYEYLASGRPILGAVPPGDAHDILQRVGHTTVPPDDITAIANAIATAIAAHDAGEPLPDFRWDIVETFERRETTNQLAELLSTLSGKAARVSIEA